MKRSFQFLWQFTWRNLLVIVGVAAALAVAACLSGGQRDRSDLLCTYFGLFPLMAIMIVFVLAFNLCTVDLDIAVSLGGRRRDFFWALQGNLLGYMLACWGLQRLVGLVPSAMGWENPEDWQMLLSIGDQPWWWYPLICMTALAAGCLCGVLMARNKVIGILIILLLAVAGSIATVVLMLTTFHDFHLLGDLPRLLPLIYGVVFLVCQGLLWRFIQGYCVR